MPWRCEGCGLQYDGEPEVCPDCLHRTFERIGGASQTTEQPETEADENSFPEPGLGYRQIGGGAVLLLALIGGVWWVTTGGIALGPGYCAEILDTEPASDTIDRPYVECKIHQAVNEQRDQRNLATLDFHTGRQTAARDLAEMMAQRELSPDEASSSLNHRDVLRKQNVECPTDKHKYWTVFDVARYQHPMVHINGTIVRYDTNSELAEGVVARSLAYHETRELVLDTGYGDHAVGSYVTSSNTVYAVQIYC